MSLVEILESVQFLVDSQGKKTAVQLKLEAWEALRQILEELEDERLGRLMTAVDEDERLTGEAAWQAYQSYLSESQS